VFHALETALLKDKEIVFLTAVSPHWPWCLGRQIKLIWCFCYTVLLHKLSLCYQWFFEVKHFAAISYFCLQQKRAILWVLQHSSATVNSFSLPNQMKLPSLAHWPLNLGWFHSDLFSHFRLHVSLLSRLIWRGYGRLFISIKTQWSCEYIGCHYKHQSQCRYVLYALCADCNYYNPLPVHHSVSR